MKLQWFDDLKKSMYEYIAVYYVQVDQIYLI